jgi:allantoinase
MIMARRMPAAMLFLRSPGGISHHPDEAVMIELVDLSQSHTLRAADLHQRHPLSPYVGVKFHGTVRRTIRRGETIFQDGVVTARHRGRWVRPCSAKENHA